MEYQVTQDRILSNDFTLAMLRELAERHLGMSPDAVTKLANAALSKASKTMANLNYAKLRTAILTKMSNGFSQEYPSWTEDGTVTLDFACLEPEPKAEEPKAEEPKAEEPKAEEDPMANAGANNRKRASAGTGEKKAPAHKGAVPRKGAYRVVKEAGNAKDDEGKWTIWQHVWNCSTFEDYFAKAPAKSTTKTGRLITASSEIGWALKSGWIEIVAEEPAAE